ncbi:MAG: prepilin peptidase [Bacteriovoracaceae bacterium]
MEHLKFQVLAFIYASLFGSFLNVVIYRLPRKLDLVFARSQCPKCGHKIHWYELVPIFSFLFLRAKCSNCKTPISWRYPITELVIALMAVYLFPVNVGLQSITLALFYFLTFSIFVCHFQIDLEHKILPDSLNIILFSMFLSFGIFMTHWTHWLLGGALGFLFPLGITWLFYLIRGQVGLGGGDIKLYGILGIILGPELVVQNIFTSCFLGALIGGFLIWRKKLKRDESLPFGPFILVVAFIQIFFPQVAEYFSKLI